MTKNTIKILHYYIKYLIIQLDYYNHYYCPYRIKYYQYYIRYIIIQLDYYLFYRIEYD